MSERRQRGEDSRLSDLAALFDLSPDLLCVAGFDGYFKLLNPAWEAALGYTSEELCAKPFIDFVHPYDREATLDQARRLMDGGETRWFQNRYLKKDGGYRLLQWAVRTCAERQRYYAVARDVTDQVRVDHQLLQLRQALDGAVEAIARLEASSVSGSRGARSYPVEVG